MWRYRNPISLIRYLLVWRVNSSLVQLPGCLSAELSSVLGAIIAERLPTSETYHWQKALAPWDFYFEPPARAGAKKNPKVIPEASWPIEAVLLVYPGKRTYGRGELILWELKLIGDGADHGFFLEVILPAMEEAGCTPDPRWNRPNRLWGRFDIYSVYVARGAYWEPLVSDGKLNLRYRASPVQWVEGFDTRTQPKGLELEREFSSPTRLTWITPFNLLGENFCKRKNKKAPPEIPALRHILEALAFRVNLLSPGGAQDILDIEGQPTIQDAMGQALNVPILHKSIKPAPKDWSGCWVGTQIFSHIPPAIIPYLELASILHVGRQTHFGCGTFSLIQSTSDIIEAW